MPRQGIKFIETGINAMKILVINGPNLNLLGSREPSVYGRATLEDLLESLVLYGRKKGIIIEHYQSNSEGALIDCLHRAAGGYDGIIFNPGAYTHYSYALRDAVSAICLPVVEVHISNIYKREEFRHTSVIAPACAGQISGLGLHGYFLAVDYFARLTQPDRQGDEA